MLQQGNCFLINVQQPERDISSQTEQDTARNLGQWMSFILFFFSHSTLAHICLQVHSVDADLSHRVLSLSPNINYGSGLKAFPAAPLQILQPIPLPAPLSAPRFIQIYCPSLQQSLRSSQPPITPPWRSHPSYTDSSEDKPGDKFLFFAELEGKVVEESDSPNGSKSQIHSNKPSIPALRL